MHLWWKILPQTFHRHWIDLSRIVSVSLPSDHPNGCMDMSFSFLIRWFRISFPTCLVPWIAPHSSFLHCFLACAMSFFYHGAVSRPSTMLVGEGTTAAEGSNGTVQVWLVVGHLVTSKVLPGVFQDGPALPLDEIPPTPLIPPRGPHHVSDGRRVPTRIHVDPCHRSPPSQPRRARTTTEDVLPPSPTNVDDRPIVRPGR